MPIEITVLGAVLSIIVILASGGALYVSMKVSSSIANLKNDLIKELDDRYVRRAEHTQLDSMREERDAAISTAAKEKLEGIEIEVHRYRDDLDITLKGILAAIEEKRLNR